MNSKQKGSIGVAKAIAYFAGEGNSVSVPIGDGQRYDLVVDIDGKLYRVEVKTTLYVNVHGKYQVNLKTCTRKSDAWSIKHLNERDCDLVFIYVGDGSQYLFPVDKLEGKGTMVITKKLDSYKISS